MLKLKVFFLLLRVVGNFCDSCLTTEETKSVKCVFPFTYQGTKYSGCTNVTDVSGQLWCATNVDENSLYVPYSNNFGYCATGCPNNIEGTIILDTRSLDGNVKATDKRCTEDEDCKNQSQCLEFLAQKSYLKTLPRNGKEFKETLQKIKVQVCNRKKKAVCCPKKKVIASDDVRTPAKTGMKSLSWLPSKDECGINPLSTPSNVFGGEDTAPGQFPFTALLGSTEVSQKRGRAVKQTRFKCGGTLINYWYVVTAAHCQGASERSQISSVRLGDWMVGNDPDCIFGTSTCLDHVQDFKITAKQVTVHKNFGRTTTNVLNDIALVKLDRPAVLNKGVQIACLPVNMPETAEELNLPDQSADLTGTFPIVVGWGYTEYDPQASGTLKGNFERANVASTVQQMLGVPVLSSEKCTEKWGGKFKAEETQICAGGEKGKDSCKGDSGGPLYLSRVATTGRPVLDGLHPLYLVGLVSFGSKECGAGVPGVYTRLESFVPWIMEQIRI